MLIVQSYSHTDKSDRIVGKNLFELSPKAKLKQKQNVSRYH